MKTGIIIQARTSSTRLPAKVLKDLPYGSGISALAQCIRRCKQATKVDQVIVATTIDPADEVIVKIAKKEKVKYFKGSVQNVLERYYLTAKENKLDCVVRVTSDCPCIDPKIIDYVISCRAKAGSDYASNAIKRTCADGLDVEVFTFTALKKAYEEASNNEEREHVTAYIHDHPEKFKVVHVKKNSRLDSSHLRITLDTLDDYALLCALFDQLYPKKHYFSGDDIAKLFEKKPWLRMINEKLEVK